MAAGARTQEASRVLYFIEWPRKEETPRSSSFFLVGAIRNCLTRRFRVPRRIQRRFRVKASRVVERVGAERVICNARNRGGPAHYLAM